MNFFGLFFVVYFKRSVLGFWALWVIFLVVLWCYFGMVMRARVFLGFLGKCWLLWVCFTWIYEIVQWAGCLICKKEYIQINLYVYYLMMKVMKKDALVSMVVWLILVVHPLKLIFANMEGLWGPSSFLVIFEVYLCCSILWDEFQKKLKFLVLESQYLFENEMKMCKIGLWIWLNVLVVEFSQNGKQDKQWAPYLVIVASSSVLLYVIIAIQSWCIYHFLYMLE